MGASEPKTSVDAPAEPAFSPVEDLVEYAQVGSKLVQSTMRTPAPVVVITGDQLLRGGFQSVGEALATIPGIFISDDLQNVHVAVRGIFGGARAGSRSLRVLIDGVPVTYLQSGVHLLGPELIPLSAIERVEVLKGPASALYGTGALVGAVNIVTRRPAYEGELTLGAELRLRGGIGGQRGGGGELTATLTGEKASVLVGFSGDFLDRSGLTAAAGPFAQNFTLRGASVGDTSTPLSGIVRADSALLGGRVSGLVIGQFLNRGAEFHDLSVLSHNTRVSLLNFVANVQYERPFASGFGLVGKVGVNAGGPGSSERYDFGTTNSFFLVRRAGAAQFNATLEGRYDTDNGGSFVLGTEFTQDVQNLSTWVEVNRDNGTRLDRATPPTVNISNIAAYLNAQYPVTSWLSLAGGARFDFNTVVGSMLGARAGVVFHLGERAAIKALFGRSHRAPSPEQLFGIPATFLDICGPQGAAATSCTTNRLVPQYLTGGELNLDVFVTPWLSANVTGYVNRLDNNLAYLLRGTSLVPTPYNATQGGGEGLARLAAPLSSTFTLTGSAGIAVQTTITDQQLVGGILQKDVPNNEAVPTVSALASLGLRYAPLKLSGQLDYRYVGNRTPSQSNLRANGTADMDQPNYTLSRYHSLNLTLSVTPIQFAPTREIGFQVRVSNLLNARWSEIGFNGVDVPNLGTTGWLMARITL